jgi:hypothetical protein
LNRKTPELQSPKIEKDKKMTYTGYDGVDTVSQAMLNKLNETCNKFTNIDLSLKAADGDKESALKNWMETADNPQAAKLRTTIANATAKLREMAESNVETVTLSDEDKTKLQVEQDELKTQIKAGIDVIKSLIQNLSPDPEGVQAALDSIDNPVKSNRGRKPGSAGSSLPRVSANITVHGGNFDDPEMTNEFDSFSKVALALNVEVKDLQVAFAQAAGVKHEDIKTVNKPVEFQFNSGAPNATTYTLKTTPKDRAKPGPKGPKSEDENKTEESSDSSEQSTEAA